MPKRYRLTARAQMHGEVREPGYAFELGDGETGPHKAARSGDIGYPKDGDGLVNIPLYEEIPDVVEADAGASESVPEDAAQEIVTEEPAPKPDAE